ncbi:hypothetical protein RQP46_004021 [Phenoliferia psychrophenolica]
MSRRASYVAKGDDEGVRTAWPGGLASHRPSVGQLHGVTVPLLYEDDEEEEVLNYRDDVKANDMPARMKARQRNLRDLGVQRNRRLLERLVTAALAVTLLTELKAVHSEGGNLALNSVFDIKSFSYYSNVSMVEWRNVKIPDVPGTRHEKLSCWGWRDERPLARYNVHTDFWPPPGQLTVPSSIETSMTFPAIEVLVSQSQDTWLKETAIRYFGSVEKAPAFPDSQLLCFENLFYVPSTHFVEGAVDRSYAIEEFAPDDPVWSQVGRHLYFSDAVNRIADELLHSLLGSTKNPFVAIHIRQGDFVALGRTALAVADSYLAAEQAVQIELAGRKRPGLFSVGTLGNRRLPVLFTTDSEDPIFVEKLVKLGWIHVDHTEFATATRFGGWYPGILDSVLLSRSIGFVGTKMSTFSYIAARRVETWNGGPAAPAPAKGAKGKGKGKEAGKSQKPVGALPGTLHDFFRPAGAGAAEAAGSSSRGTVDSASARSLSTSSSLDSWPAAAHRFAPASPSVSPSHSQGSTVRFSPSRSYAQIDPSTFSPARSAWNASEDGDISIGSPGAVDGWGTGRIEVGVQAGSPQVSRVIGGKSVEQEMKGGLTPEELNALVEGVDFDDDDLSWDEHAFVEENVKMQEPESTAPPSSPFVRPSPRAVARPSPSASPRSPLRIHRPPSPPSPLSPNGTPDLFSPPTFHIASTSRRPVPPSPRLASPSPRLFSTSSANAAPRRNMIDDLADSSDVEIQELTDDVRAFLKKDATVARPTFKREDGDRDGVVIESDDSDVEIVAKKSMKVVRPRPAAPRPKPKYQPKVVERPRSPSVAAAAKTAPSGAKAGWFTKPESLSKPSVAPPLPPPASLAAAKPLPPKPQVKPAYSAASAKPAKTTTRTGKPVSLWMQRKYEKDASKAEKDKKLKDSLQPFRWDKWGTKTPRLIYSINEAEIKKELDKMTGPLGFDLEWEPTTRRGAAPNKTALAQICDNNTILLVHVSRMRQFSPSLKQLIEDPKRIKLGVQIAGDGRKLKADFGHRPAGMLELNNIARLVDGARWEKRTTSGLIGLQNLTAIYLDRYLAKDQSVRCGAWAGDLSEEQRFYAANDVYSSLQICRYLQDLARPDVNVMALASDNVSTASSWRPPKAALGSVIPPRALSAESESDDDELEVFVKPAAPAKRVSLDGATSLKGLRPTPRQLEAYHLWHEKGLDPDAASVRMSGTGRSMKPLSVMWNILACLEKQPGLEFDDVRLAEGLAEVGAEGSSLLMKDHGSFIEELRNRVER